MKYSVIIVAAGKGTRTGLTYNKVFYKINNEPIICKTLRPFLTDEDCERIIISIAPTEQKDFESLITSPKVVYTFGAVSYTHLDVYKRQELMLDRLPIQLLQLSHKITFLLKYSS